jgi:hypothetical protein
LEEILLLTILPSLPQVAGGRGYMAELHVKVLLLLTIYPSSHQVAEGFEDTIALQVWLTQGGY